MKRRLPHLVTVLSLLLSAAAVVTIIVFPEGVERSVYRGSFGWRDGEGWVVAGIGLYELHAFGGPVIILSLPRGVLNFFAFLGTCVAALIWAARRFGARPRAGHCPRCGYDLRATPDRCPECGERVRPPASG